MSRRRILIIGKNGQVGFELRRSVAPLGDVTATGSSELDLAREESIYTVLDRVKPDVIINAAGHTAVDKAEDDRENAEKLNAEAPAVLARYSKQNDVLLVHYSTDYVFDGTGKRPYLETDPAAPLCVYGSTKNRGDVAIRESGCAHLIFRLCWVYGVRGRNFFLTMRRLAASREELRVVSDQRGCPTSSRLIAEATAQALGQVLRSRSPESYYGTYHLASDGEATWHQFASKIIELMPAEKRICTQVTPITTAEYPTAAVRPAYSVLDCGKLKDTFGIELPHWEAVLELVNEELNTQN